MTATHTIAPLLRLPQAGQKALVIGAGKSGLAAVRLLVSTKVQVTLLESAVIQDSVQAEMHSLGVAVIQGPLSTEVFAGQEYIVPSPGIPVAKVKKLVPTAQTTEVLAEMELASRYLQDEPILAVTGTSGKTTTVSLAAAMLEAAGKKVFLGGNIGTPLSEYVLERNVRGHKADVLVLEVSSFQLQGCSSFAPHVAMLLNITENHLDYHEDMQEYIDAKMQLFASQKAQDVAIFPLALQETFAKYPVSAQKVFFDTDQGNFPERMLLGAHNAVNIEAAWQACKPFGISLEAARKAVASFAPLAHRLEKVRDVRGVLYVNDSKCTTVDAMRVALEAFDSPIILLCGGKFKGGDLPSLCPLLQKNVKNVVLFGASREYFEKAWGHMTHITPMPWFATLAEAVQHAQVLANTGDIVLLAPATASFDLYTSYIKRGEDFKAIVEGLL